mgnify:CR=1 FL=1
MLWTITVILLILWALGLVSSYTLGGFIHILLVVAVVMVLVRLIQGSGTVAMITGASISAPILVGMGDVNMVFAAQAAAMASVLLLKKTLDLQSETAIGMIQAIPQVTPPSNPPHLGNSIDVMA